MTMNIPLPFKLRSGRTPLISTKDAAEISVENLVDLVTGKDRRFSRSQAMLLLRASDAPDKHLAFESVLGDQEEVPEVRYEAALHLGRLKSVAAMDTLIRNSTTQDPLALRGIAKALGLVGNASALPALTSIENSSSGTVSKLARFSAALIAHRHNLAGHDLPVPDPRNNLKLSGERNGPIKLRPAKQEELERCLKAISEEPYGISIDTKTADTLICGKRRFLVLFDRRIAAARVLKVKNRKALPAVIAAHNVENDSYSIAYLVLSSPARTGDRIDLLLARTNGDIAFSGRAVSDGEGFKFEVSATPRPGGHAVSLKGEVKASKLSLSEGLSSLSVQVPKNVPAPLTRAFRRDG